MTKMNWDRVRMERLMARFGTAHFLSDRLPPLSDSHIANRRRAIQAKKINKIAARSEIEAFLLKLGEDELLKMEDMFERWLYRATDEEVTALVKALSPEEMLVVNFIMERSQARLKEEFKAMQALDKRIKKSNARINRKREKNKQAHDT